MIARGYTVAPQNRAELHQRLKREIPEAVYGLHMQGHRMLVALDPADEMYRGVLLKPKRAVEREQTEMGSGWVVAVGPVVGQPGAPHPVGLMCDAPEDALGLHVYFQMWTGKVFRTDEDDEEFSGTMSLVVLTDKDIQSCDEQVPKVEP